MIALIVREAWDIRLSVDKVLPHLHGRSCAGFDRSDISIQLFDQFPDLDIILHIQEVTVRYTEKATQPDGSIGSDLSPVMENILNSGSRHMNTVRKFIGGEIHRNHEFFRENFAHRRGWNAIAHDVSSFPTILSVIIDNLHIKEVVAFDTKADPVLIVDPNAVLSFPVTIQLFQTVGRRDTQILQASCIVNHDQFP